MSMTTGAPVQTQGPNNMPGMQQKQPMPAGPAPVTPAPMYAPAQSQMQPYAYGGNVFTQSANTLTDAANTAQGVANFTPSNVYAPKAQTSTVANTSLDPYMNPYTQSVIDTTMAGMADQQQMALNDIGASASAAGAYGGSRHGVAEAQSYDAYAQAQAEALAGLNNANFTQAQQAAMYDTTALNQGSQFNANNSLQAQMSNQNAGIQGANTNLNAANTLGGLSQTGFDQGMAITNQQNTMGQQYQGINQMLIDAAKGQYGGFTGAPAQSLNMLLAAAGIPTGTTTTQEQTSNPGLFDYLGLAATAVSPG